MAANAAKFVKCVVIRFALIACFLQKFLGGFWSSRLRPIDSMHRTIDRGQ